MCYSDISNWIGWTMLICPTQRQRKGEIRCSHMSQSPSSSGASLFNSGLVFYQKALGQVFQLRVLQYHLQIVPSLGSLDLIFFKCKMNYLRQIKRFNIDSIRNTAHTSFVLLRVQHINDCLHPGVQQPSRTFQPMPIEHKLSHFPSSPLAHGNHRFPLFLQVYLL